MNWVSGCTLGWLRHLFITGGWQWLNVDGGGFGAHGLQFGLSFTFGNLRTFFWVAHARAGLLKLWFIWTFRFEI